jgi:DNA-directed RNA polymerase specialized sigma24 family protein
MRPDLFTLLDGEWAHWRRGPGPGSALRRWAETEPCLRRIPHLDALLAMFERCGSSTHVARDEALLAMVRLSPGDPDACRTLLHLLRAGLVNLTSRAARWWGWEEAASAVAAAALDRVNRYPMRRTDRVAANLLGDVWHSVWTLRQGELRHAAGRVDLVDVSDLHDVAADDEPGVGQELLALVGEAVSQGRISRRDARLVALHRVFGFTNVEVAGLEGCRPCTVRKRRVAAETAIAELAVA